MSHGYASDDNSSDSHVTDASSNGDSSGHYSQLPAGEDPVGLYALGRTSVTRPGYERALDERVYRLFVTSMKQKAAVVMLAGPLLHLIGPAGI